MSRKTKLPAPGLVFKLFMAGATIPGLCRMFGASVADVAAAIRVHVNRIENRRHR